MVFINKQHANYPPPKDGFGGAICTCDECTKLREGATMKQQTKSDAKLPAGCKGCNSTLPCEETCGADPFTTKPNAVMMVNCLHCKDNQCEEAGKEHEHTNGEDCFIGGNVPIAKPSDACGNEVEYLTCMFCGKKHDPRLACHHYKVVRESPFVKALDQSLQHSTAKLEDANGIISDLEVDIKDLATLRTENKALAEKVEGLTRMVVKDCTYRMTEAEGGNGECCYDDEPEYCNAGECPKIREAMSDTEEEQL